MGRGAIPEAFSPRPSGHPGVAVPMATGSPRSQPPPIRGMHPTVRPLPGGSFHPASGGHPKTRWIEAAAGPAGGGEWSRGTVDRRQAGPRGRRPSRSRVRRGMVSSRVREPVGNHRRSRVIGSVTTPRPRRSRNFHSLVPAGWGATHPTAGVRPVAPPVPLPYSAPWIRRPHVEAAIGAVDRSRFRSQGSIRRPRHRLLAAPCFVPSPSSDLRGVVSGGRGAATSNETR